MEGTYLETALQAALQLCDFDFLKNAKVQTFTNGRNLDTIEKTKFLVHKYDFIQVGFQIDEAWYRCDSKNYVLTSGGAPQGGHAVGICGFDSTGFYIFNQWGNWGAKGFAIMPYDLFLKELMYGAFLTGITY